MGRLTIRSGQRMLNFSPTDAAFGKNPGQLEPLAVPHNDRPEFADFLADVIAQTKAKLNTLTEVQAKAQAELEAWRLALNDIEDADGINALIPKAKDNGDAAKALLVDRAKKLGLSFDPKAKAYTAEPKAA
jgi:hypothetical protein